MRVMSVIGTRPQVIKYNMMSKQLKEHGHEDILVHSGQHYDYNMNEIFFDNLNIKKPDVFLGIHEVTHGKQFGLMIPSIENVMKRKKPDVVLVYGDCDTTLSGAIASSYLNIPVAHIEAGLRCGDMTMPEEKNRIVTDHLSTFLFTPTEHATVNLHNENIVNHVVCVGDIMYESFRFHEKKAGIIRGPEIFSLIENGFYLATIHRAENTDNSKRLDKIVESLQKVNKPVVIPVHPRIRKHIKHMGWDNNIFFSRPFSYLEMLYMEKNASMIITDSGGVQCESYFVKKPCIVLRKTTEYSSLQKNWFECVDVDVDDITKVINEYKQPNTYTCLFNHWHISDMIVSYLEDNV